jgi:rhodanese-related sulfurtransferase
VNPSPGIPSIQPREAAGLLDEGAAVLVDVRERDEFETERAPGAALVPISEFVARFEELPRDRPLLVVCAAGSRSASATAYLLQRGWTDVRNVTGGMIAWRAAGLPITSGAPAAGEGDLPG